MLMTHQHSNYTEKMASEFFLILPIYCKYHPTFKLHKPIFYVSVSYVKVCAKFLIFTLKWELIVIMKIQVFFHQSNTLGLGPFSRSGPKYSLLYIQPQWKNLDPNMKGETNNLNMLFHRTSPILFSPISLFL